MDDIHITHIDGEPPIYREMKAVSVSLDQCILNSEEDYQYNEGEESLMCKDYVDGDLSAEEINSMIMINEGPNALEFVLFTISPKLLLLLLFVEIQNVELILILGT